MLITRRKTLALLSAGGLTPEILWAENPRPIKSDVITEKQKGDPGMQYEIIRIDREELSRVRAGNKATFLKRIPNFGSLIVSEADKWVGKTRRNAKNEITNLLELFNFPFSINGIPVPFCAAGISYVAALAYARTDPLKDKELGPGVLSQYLGDVEYYHFGPSASVRDMYHLAEGKRRWVPRLATQKAAPKRPKIVPQPGWLAVYDFGGGYDHVGLVEKFEGTHVRSIEFNTIADGAVGDERDGGAIARKKRDIAKVRGFIDTSKRV